jgi:hypothetical protein
MTMTREEALAQVLRVAADMQDRDWVPAGAVEVHEWAGELMAAHEAIAALGGGEVERPAGCTCVPGTPSHWHRITCPALHAAALSKAQP